MLSAILTAAGERAPAVGNVGTPAVTAATDPTVDVLAVELSSFQLHFTSSLAAQAAVVLNVAPDHLDWHGGRSPAAVRIAESMPTVVVLPFVPVTTSHGAGPRTGT